MKKITLIIFAVLLLLIPIQAFAIDFDPEEVFSSVVVINTVTSVGSGFAVAPDLVVTNAHVIGNSMYIRVTRYDGTSSNALVVKEDTDADLAVLFISEGDLTPLTWAQEPPSIGDNVYAIGAPKDIPYTMTSGIVSALNRQMGSYHYLQIDASINSGNSGGPLLNSAGEVLGINTLKLEDAEGIGFAIPSEQVLAFIENISYEVDDDGSITIDEPENHKGTESTEDDDLARRYEKVRKENEALRIAVIILSLMLFITVLLLIRSMIRPKRKNEFDFEIEIEE